MCGKHVLKANLATRIFFSAAVSFSHEFNHRRSISFFSRKLTLSVPKTMQRALLVKLTNQIALLLELTNQIVSFLANQVRKQTQPWILICRAYSQLLVFTSGFVLVYYASGTVEIYFAFNLTFYLLTAYMYLPRGFCQVPIFRCESNSQGQSPRDKVRSDSTA